MFYSDPIAASVFVCVVFVPRAVVNKFIKVTYRVNLLYGGFLVCSLPILCVKEKKGTRATRIRKQLGGNFPRARICIK
jgi:hypothetical protein